MGSIHMGAQYLELSKLLKEPWFKTASLGLALCFVLRSQNSFSINQLINISSDGSLSSLSVLSIGSSFALILCILFCLAKRKENVGENSFLFRSHPGRIFCLATLDVLVIASLFLIGKYCPGDLTISFILNFILGVVNSFFIIAWGELFLNKDWTTALLGLGMALLFSALSQFILVLLYEFVRVGILICLPPLSCWLLVKSCSLSSGIAEHQPPQSSQKIPMNALLFFSTIIGYHFLNAYLRTQWQQSYDGVLNSIVFQSAAAVGILIAVFFIFGSIRFKKDEFFAFYPLLCIVMILAAFYLSLFFKGIWLAFIIIPLYIAYYLIFSLFWSFALYQNNPFSRISTLCFGLLCIEVGKTLNQVFTCYINSNHASNEVLALGITSSILILLLGKDIFSAFLWQKRKLDHVEANYSIPYRNDCFTLACELLIDRHALSPREQEVFQYLARGRNAEYISKQLVIEAGTVKTHIVRIYRKLNINSQQQLIDAVEEAIKEVEAIE